MIRDRFDRHTIRAVQAVLRLQGDAWASTAAVSAHAGVPLKCGRQALYRLARAGRVERRRVSAALPRVTLEWRPTARLTAVRVGAIEAMIVDRLRLGPAPFAELVTLAALRGIGTRNGVKSTLYRMQQREMVTRDGATYALTAPDALPLIQAQLGLRREADDGWTPPTQYITAARAYALGLPVAGRRSA